MPGNHAVLSASSSDRWIHCPPSARVLKYSIRQVTMRMNLITILVAMKISVATITRIVKAMQGTMLKTQCTTTIGV